MTETIAIVDHPCNLDRSASLIPCRIDLKWVNKEIYRVRGGYLVCVGFNLALRELALSESEAIAAQKAYFKCCPHCGSRHTSPLGDGRECWDCRECF